ncbi:pilus assembly protein TadB [Frankia casuarinae]|uniref:type II secretion system F family protein n=1 Tax=Frankia casuarinae (strain DSM 45818 / CECT 9043 / HFP020203 / CcI3) TaxID=106370 RepID=UPI000A114687|nr:pilus assembly protein TadB [Frankia casuarinae]ORT98529.1 pilus assembly protein TadB [Frankia casuarinae]
MTGLFGLLGLGVGAGLLLIVYGWRGPDDDAGRPRRRPVLPRPWRTNPRFGRWAAAAAACGIVAGAVTGWVVGGLLIAMGVYGLPRMLGPDREQARQVARTQGIAVWAEQLRDTLAAAAGLEQAIVATAPAAPAAIRDEIALLAVRVERRERLGPALRALADDLDDPLADLVIGALILASEHQARQLSGLLGQLAATARAQVDMLGRIEVGRARMRTTMRVVVVTSLVFAGGLVIFNRAFLEPYSTAAGQMVLLAVGAIFVSGFVWLKRMSKIENPGRFLRGDETATAISQPVSAAVGRVP